MKTILKFAAAATLAGALAAGMGSPAQARHGCNTTAAIGFGAGALVGAAATNAANSGYYGTRYYATGHHAYYAKPGYRAYAYAPRPSEYSSRPMCVIQGSYGHEYDTSFC